MISESEIILVKGLRKRFSCYKSQIKEKTPKSHWFPIIKLFKCEKLDEYSQTISECGFNDCLDRKINKIAYKLDPNVCQHSEPPIKRQRCDNTVVDLMAITDENEELNFEESDDESENKNKSNKTNGYQTNHTKVKSESISRKHTINGIIKSESNKKPNLTAYDMNGMFSNASDLNFKIPKCSDKKESIESIVNHVNSLVKHPKRCSDAFTYLKRYLTEDDWKKNEIIIVLAEIAKGMANNKDLGSLVDQLSDVTDKIKSLQYTEDDFWDELIYSVDKKKNEIKSNHKISLFLSGLYEYLFQNKINARVVCNEAVIYAYRSFASNQNNIFIKT